jgi:hypothetical protein
MEQQNSQSIWKTVFVIIITAVVAGGGVYWRQSSVAKKAQDKMVSRQRALLQKIEDLQSNIVQVQETRSDWQTYVSGKGFSLRYPPGHEVNEVTDPENPNNTIVNIVAVDEKGKPMQRPPALQINVSQDAITFSLWEGMPWDGFPEIVETFRSKQMEKVSESTPKVGEESLTVDINSYVGEWRTQDIQHTESSYVDSAGELKIEGDGSITGMIHHVSIYEGNLSKTADAEVIGKISRNKAVSKFEDDGWGNSGELILKFEKERIIGTIKITARPKEPQNWGIEEETVTFVRGKWSSN